MWFQNEAFSAGPWLLVFVLPGLHPCYAAELAKNATPIAVQWTRAERLLPDSTLAFVSVTNLPSVTERWIQQGFRPFLDNPALRAFFGRLEEQFPAEWNNPGFRWGLLLELPAGEACVALAKSPGGQPVCIFMLDCRGRREKAVKFFDRLGCGSKTAFALPESESVGDTRLLHHKYLSYFIKDDLLVATTKGEVTKDILRSWPGNSAVVTGELYRAVMEQAGTGAEKAEPDIRWFLRPVEFLELQLRSIASRSAIEPMLGSHFLGVMLQAARTTLESIPIVTWSQRLWHLPDSLFAMRPSFSEDDTETNKARLRRDIVRKTGLELIFGVGGSCWLDHDRHALVYRVGVHAPKQGTSAQKTLLIPNCESHAPPAWVPKEAGGYGSLRCELQRGIEPLGDLFDLVVGEGDHGVFEEILQGLLKDPNGPRVDFRGDVIERLRTRVVTISAPRNLDEPVWTRSIFGFEITDEAVVERAFAKDAAWMATGPKQEANQPRYRIGEHAVYELVNDSGDSQEQPPALLDLPSLPRQDPNTREPNAKQSHRSSFVSVAHGYLLWGHDEELLKRILKSDQGLSTDRDYRRVMEELERLAPGPVSCRSFSRYGDDFRLLERCTTPWGLTGLIQGWDEDFQKGLRKKQPVDHGGGSAFQPSVGPGGWVGHPIANGCRIAGCVLKP